MKKFSLIFYLCVLLFIFGCVGKQPDNQKNEGISNHQSNNVPLAKGATRAQKSDLPKEVSNWYDIEGNEKGTYVYQHPDYTYVKISAGQKPTGGYDVIFNSLIDRDFEKDIIVEFSGPKSGELVPQVITYPELYIKVDSNSYVKYTVKTTTGEVLPTKDKYIGGIINSPKENDTISNPIKVEGKIAAFEGAFVVKIYDVNNKLLKEEHLQTDGAPVWGSFSKDISYKTPTIPKGYIEIGEYSAADGRFIQKSKVNINFSK